MIKAFSVISGLGASAFAVFLTFTDVSPSANVEHTIHVSSVPSAARSTTALQPITSGDRTSLGPLPQEYSDLLSAVPNLGQPTPTNRWWSLGLMDNWPSRLFLWPLSVELNADGALISAPVRRVIPTAVVSDHPDILRVFIDKQTMSKAEVQRWGDWNVTFRSLLSTGQPGFDMTVTKGSPFTFFTSHVPQLSYVLPPGSNVQSIGNGVVITADQTTYLAYAPGAEFIKSGGVMHVRFGAEKLLSIGVVPPDANYEQLIPYASVRPRTSFSYEVFPDGVETTFRYDQQTLMGVFPHQQHYLRQAPGELIGTYQTLRGPLRLYRGRQFTTVLPTPHLLPGLPLLEGMADDYEFLNHLTNDIVGQPALPAEVYSSGKNVLRSAQLAELARQKGDSFLERESLQAARERMTQWCTYSGPEDSHYFAYDQHNGGIIAIPTAFGSEHYNDHHFHYGYFIHAAAILARLDEKFASEFGDCIQVLIRDIAASSKQDESFPFLRYFDVYAGHSWAHGLTKLADGNDQESTSEAMQAWFAIALWGKATGDSELTDLGTWLLAQEAAAARIYWLRAEPQLDIYPAEFDKPMISILWGGKVDYATFFDASPQAIHGIQFFPVGTSLFSVLDQAMLDRLVRPLLDAAPSTIWKTNAALAYAIANPKEARTLFTPLDPIDYFYTRAYMDLWISGLDQLGEPVLEARAQNCSGMQFRKNNQQTTLIYRHASDSDTCTFSNGRTEANLAFGWNVR